MLCPQCRLDLRITNNHRAVTGDKSPYEPTRVYEVQDLTCINPQCANYMTVVTQDKTLIYETPPELVEQPEEPAAETEEASVEGNN